LPRRTTLTFAALGALAALTCAVPSLALAATSATATRARATQRPLTVTDQGGPSLGSFRVISYLPTTSRSGSTSLANDLWGTYNHATVQSGLSLISGMGANAVRVFVSTGDTGASYPAVSPTFSANLADFVATARAQGLAVVLSIFNQYPYVPSVSGGWSGTSTAATWMQSVVGPYANDDEIAYIEMRNEIPAPGYDSPNPLGSGVQAMAWLNTLMPMLRSDVGTDPIVLSQNHGVAGYEALDNALSPQAKPNAYSYHFYDDPGFLFGQLSALEANLSRPVFVGETGYSTYLGNTVGGGAGIALDTASRDAYQSWYLQAVSSVTSAMGLGTPGLWQLWDTPNAESGDESNFGLYDDSTGAPAAKPAAAAVTAIFQAAARGIPVGAPSINGTFIGDGTAVPSPWNEYYISGQTESSSATGGNSVCITQAGYDSYFYETLPLAGATGLHTLTAWTDGGNSYTSVAIRWLGANGAPIGPDVRTWQPGTKTSWYQLTVTGQAPAGASTAMVILQGDSAGCFSDVAFS
jgi:hypothetical protein